MRTVGSPLGNAIGYTTVRRAVGAKKPAFSEASQASEEMRRALPEAPLANINRVPPARAAHLDINLDILWIPVSPCAERLAGTARHPVQSVGKREIHN